MIPSEILDAARPDSPVSSAVRQAAIVTLWGHDPEFAAGWSKRPEPPTAEEFREYITARIRFERIAAG